MSRRSFLYRRIYKYCKGEKPHETAANVEAAFENLPPEGKRRRLQGDTLVEVDFKPNTKPCKRANMIAKALHSRDK